MKMMATFVLLCGIFPAFANETYISPVTGKPYEPNDRYTFEQFKARDEHVMKKTGGFLMRPAAGPLGLIVDAREKPRKLTMKEFLRLYQLGTGLEINYREEPLGKSDPIAFAQAKVEGTNNLFVVAVINGGKTLPALSVFPEERFGLVNADRLTGGDDPSAPETRVEKEVWRAIGFIGGLGYSPDKNDIMQPYYSLKELDANFQAYIQPMNMARMQGLWKRFGVVKARRTPYRAAVQQGWAPAPTNEYQKAVWDEVHALPKNPMKIEFDPKKKR